LRAAQKRQSKRAPDTNPQIACVIKKNGVEFTLYNDAEMAIIYELIREVFGDAG